MNDNPLFNDYQANRIGAVKQLLLPSTDVDSEGSQPEGGIWYDPDIEKIRYKDSLIARTIGGGINWTLKELGVLNDGSDQTENLNIAFDAYPTLWAESGDVTINGDVDGQGKTLWITNGARIIGTGSLSNVVIEASTDDVVFGEDLDIPDGGFNNSVIHARWFGMTAEFDHDLATNGFDNYDPIVRAIEAAKPGAEVLLYYTKDAVFSAGAWHGKLFYYSTRIVIDKRIIISGFGEDKSILIGPGFTFADGSRYSLARGWRTMGGALSQSTGFNSTTAHGIIINSNELYFENVGSYNYDGDGWHINSTGTNCNNNEFNKCRGNSNGRHGIYATGGDTNNISVWKGDYSYNARWGVNYGGFLQADFYGVHNASNCHQHSLNRTIVLHEGNYYGCILDHSSPHEPGESGSEAYWKLIPGFSPIFSTVWTNSGSWYTGGGFYVSEANPQVNFFGCYVEPDQIRFIGNGRSTVWGGELAYYAESCIARTNENFFESQKLRSRNESTNESIGLDASTGRIGFYSNLGQTWGLKFSGLGRAVWSFAGLEGGINYISYAATSGENTTYFGDTAPPNGTRGVAAFLDGIHMGVSGGTPYIRFDTGTAAPTTGFHKAGSFRKNTDTSTAATVWGWQCTVDGTPGTWITLSAGSAGATTLDGLTDVVITAPAFGQVLKYNGSTWINDTDATGGGGGGISGGGLTGYIAKFSGASAIGNSALLEGSGYIYLVNGAGTGEFRIKGSAAGNWWALTQGAVDPDDVNINRAGVVYLTINNGGVIKLNAYTTNGILRTTGSDGTLSVDTSTYKTGTGTNNVIQKATGAATLADSQIFDNGTNVGIGNTNTTHKLEVTGNAKLDGAVYNKVSTATDADYIVAAGDYYVMLPVITADRTITLPSAASHAGRSLVFRNNHTGGSNEWLFNPTFVVPYADVTASLSLVPPSATIKLFSDGSLWYVEYYNH